MVNSFAVSSWCWYHHSNNRISFIKSFFSFLLLQKCFWPKHWEIVCWCCTQPEHGHWWISKLNFVTKHASTEHWHCMLTANICDGPSFILACSLVPFINDHNWCLWIANHPSPSKSFQKWTTPKKQFSCKISFSFSCFFYTDTYIYVRIQLPTKIRCCGHFSYVAPWCVFA